MIKVPFDQIEKEHIEQLVDEKIEEDRRLDYKREIPDLKNTEQKRDFLKLVSSFANTVGGDILYGIEEGKESGLNTGRPEKITGLPDCNTDQIKLSMLNLIRDSIDPRIVPQVEIKPIGGFDDGPCLLVRVRRSFTGPHAVWMNKKALFYARNSGGTHPMDVNEIRMSFTMKESLLDRMKAFRHERINKIISGDTPTPLAPGPKLILHILPVEAFDPSSTQDYIEGFASNPHELIPASCYGADFRYNFDGYLVLCGSRESNKKIAYCQGFQTGNVEIVDTTFANYPQGNKFIHNGLDATLISNLKNVFSRLINLGVNPPIVVAVSLIGVKGYGINYGTRHTVETELIEHDHLILPEIFANGFEVNVKNLLKPSVDAVWRACGFPGNMHDKG